MKAHSMLTFALERGGCSVQNNLQEVVSVTTSPTGGILTLTTWLQLREVGLSGDEARKALEERRYEARVNKEALAASQHGVSGVPYFYFSGKPAFSGAQPPEAFLDATARA